MSQSVCVIQIYKPKLFFPDWNPKYCKVLSRGTSFEPLFCSSRAYSHTGVDVALSSHYGLLLYKYTLFASRSPTKDSNNVAVTPGRQSSKSALDTPKSILKHRRMIDSNIQVRVGCEWIMLLFCHLSCQNHIALTFGSTRLTLQLSFLALAKGKAYCKSIVRTKLPSISCWFYK